MTIDLRLGNKIVGALSARPGLDLFQLAEITGVKAGTGDNPLRSHLNQTLAQLRDVGIVRTNNQWGAPRFFLVKEGQANV